MKYSGGGLVNPTGDIIPALLSPGYAIVTPELRARLGDEFIRAMLETPLRNYTPTVVSPSVADRINLLLKKETEEE